MALRQRIYCIDLIEKWRPISYSFISFQDVAVPISPIFLTKENNCTKLNRVTQNNRFSSYGLITKKFFFILLPV